MCWRRTSSANTSGWHLRSPCGVGKHSRTEQHCSRPRVSPATAFVLRSPGFCKGGPSPQRGAGLCMGHDGRRWFLRMPRARYGFPHANLVSHISNAALSSDVGGDGEHAYRLCMYTYSCIYTEGGADGFPRAPPASWGLNGLPTSGSYS